MRDKRDDCVLVSNLNGTGTPGSSPTYLVRLCHNAAERIAELEAELAEHKGCATARVALYEAIRELDKAEAAIAKVRERCGTGSPRYIEIGGVVRIADILADLDGAE